MDLVGKRNKLRSVPMAAWTKAAINEYAVTAGLKEGFVFRLINKGGRVTADGLTEQAIYNMVRHYADKVRVGKIAPHYCEAENGQ